MRRCCQATITMATGIMSYEAQRSGLAQQLTGHWAGPVDQEEARDGSEAISLGESGGRLEAASFLRKKRNLEFGCRLCPSQRPSDATFALLKFHQSRWSPPLAHLLPTPQLPVTSHLALEEQREREMIFIGALVTMARSVAPHVVGGTVRGGWIVGEQSREALEEFSVSARDAGQRQALGMVMRQEQRQQQGKEQAQGGK